MPPDRDLFANFDRMRREMDELFGDMLERTGISPRRRAGFSPPVDVYYQDDPPRAVVRAEIAGVDVEEIGLEVRGRELILSGHRRPDPAEGRVYQQVEIPHGPFRRVVSLSAEVVADEARARYNDGVLTVELPIARPDRRTRSVPIEVPEAADER